MDLSRREYLKLAACAGGLFALDGCQSNLKSQSGKRKPNVSAEQLEKAASQKILHLKNASSPLIIESIELLQKDKEYFVYVKSKNGAEGLCVTNSWAKTLYPIFNQQVAPFFIGKDARNLETDFAELYRRTYKMQGLALWCPVAWMEFALLDMLGRAENKSIGNLFGDMIRKEVPFYIASSNRGTTPQEEAEVLKKLVSQTGAKAVKFKVGGRMSDNADSMPGRTEQLIGLVRKTLGDSIAIHADANGSYDPPKAIEVGKMLEDINAIHYEEPCPFDHLEDTKTVTDSLKINVAGGEQESSQRRFRWMIENRGVDIVQPDLQYYGGLIRSTKVARMAALANMATTVHISGGGMGFVYMLHFASITPKIGPYQEYKGGIEKYADWFNPKLKIVNGALTVPTGPGTGFADISAIIKDAKPVV